MKTIDVKTGRSYKIYIERGIINNAGSYIREITGAVRAAVISDSNVAPLYAQTVMSSLSENGFETSLFTFPADRITESSASRILPQNSSGSSP